MTEKMDLEMKGINEPFENLRELSTLETLLLFNPNVDEVDQKGFSPILYAASKGNLENIKILMEHGANIHMKTPSGSGILHLAAASGNLSCLKFLLQLDLEVDIDVWLNIFEYMSVNMNNG